jgi:hypothetical protein
MAAGDCFPVAARLALDLRDLPATLVHGQPVLRGNGPHAGSRYWHAWVEYNGHTLDHSNGLRVCLPTAAYYALGRIDPATCRRYPAATVAATLQEWLHYGPWDTDHPPAFI